MIRVAWTARAAADSAALKSLRVISAGQDAGRNVRNDQREEITKAPNMRLIILCTVFTLVTAADTAAQNQQFPYQAKVAVDELFVRSGGGDSWLPTQRLTRDAVVTVHRHDPGGWYMIEPPEGSFSWIPERFIRKLSDSEGEVIENNVVAFVGSEFGEDTTVWQRRLPAGEKVSILNRKELVTLSGPQVMYQIKPPRREFRWVPGFGVVPVDEQLRQQHENDP